MTQKLSPLPLPQRTMYYSLPMQMYINTSIKAPALKAVQVMFDKEAGKIQRVKALSTLWKAFVALRALPEPTKENTWHPNTHQLIELRDWLFEVCHLDSLRMGFVRKVMNFVIILYDFDPPWRWVMDSVKDRALEMEWKARGFGDNWSVNGYSWWHEEE